MAIEKPINEGYSVINGSASGSNKNYVNVWLEWKEKSQDIEKNETKVRVILYAACTKESGTAWSVADNFGYVECNGNKKYLCTTYDFSGNKVNCFGDYTFTVSHDTDGSKNVILAGAFTTKSSYISGGSVSKEVYLTNIPRGSSIAGAGDVTLGNACSVRWTPKSKAFRYKLEFSIGEWSHTTAAIHPNKTSEHTYTNYTLPLEVARQITDSDTGTMEVVLTTYSDANCITSVGTDSEKFTVTIPENEDTRPVVAMDLTPDSPFEGVYVQGLSKVQADISAEGKLGADIERYGLTVDGRSCGSSLVSGTLYASGEIVVTGSATDSREIVGTTSQRITVLPYYNPRLIGVKAYRVKVTEVETEDGEPKRKIEADDDGEYLRIEVTRDYAKVIAEDGAQRNFCSISYSYRQENSAKFSEPVEILAADAESDTVQTDPLLNATFSKEYGYVVQIIAKDTAGQKTVSTVQIPCERIFRHKRAGGRGLGLGGYCDEDDLLDVHWNALVRKDFQVKGKMKIKDDELVDYVIEQGVSDIWSYRKWSSGIAECWGNKTVELDVNNTWGNLFTSGAVEAFDVLYPIEFTDMPTLTATLSQNYAGSILMTPGNTGPQKQSTGAYEIARGTAITGKKYTINYHAIGKWK